MGTSRSPGSPSLPPARRPAAHCCRYLRILHLHGNAIGGQRSLQDSVQALASCSRLQVLTLFDTPLALAKGYRHHVVNLIWSLRALDHHVVSDSEVIEGADFPGRFAPMAPEVMLKLHWPCRRHVWEELEHTFLFLYEVRRLQAKHSPIQTIQRFWRSIKDRRRRAPKPGQPPAPPFVVPPLVSRLLVRAERRHMDDDALLLATSPGFFVNHERMTPQKEQRVAGALRLDALLEGGSPERATDAVISVPDAQARLGDAAPAPGQADKVSDGIADPIFKVDRYQLLDSLRSTLIRHGQHREISTVNWDLELPKEATMRLAQHELETLREDDGSFVFPAVMAQTKPDKPLSVESLLQIADELAAAPARAGDDVARQGSTKTPFTALLIKHGLASEPDVLARNAVEAGAAALPPGGDGPEGMEAEVKPAPIEHETPMRHKLFDPKAAGDRLRTFLLAQKQATEDQEAAERREKNLTTDARRQTAHSRYHRKLNRQDDAISVAQFLRPLVANEKARRGHKLHRKAEHEKRKRVFKARAIDGGAVVRQMEDAKERFQKAQDLEFAHRDQVDAKLKAEDEAVKARAEQLRRERAAEAARMDAIRAERAERQSTFSRYNTLANTSRREQAGAKREQRFEACLQKVLSRKQEKSTQKKEYDDWMDHFKVARSADRKNRRKLVEDRRQTTQLLREEAHRLKVAKVRGERLDSTSRKRIQLQTQSQSLNLNPQQRVVNRSRPTYHGLRGAHESLRAEPVSMETQLFDAPGLNASVQILDLPAREYPKSMRHGLPRPLVHEALQDELHESWGVIGQMTGTQFNP